MTTAVNFVLIRLFNGAFVTDRLYPAPATEQRSLEVANIKQRSIIDMQKKTSIGARPTGRYDMRLSRIISDKYHRNEAFPLLEMYLTICVKWVGDHLGLGLTMKICARNDFHIFVHCDLDP